MIGALVREDRLRKLGLLAFSSSSLSGDLIAALQYLKRAYQGDGEGFFVTNCSDGTRGNGLKLKEGKFRLDVWKKFSTLRMGRHWKRLPLEAVDAPALAMFNAILNRALSNQV